MATLTIGAYCSPDGSTSAFARNLPGTAGEAILAGQALYLKSDGLLWLADGSSADALAEIVGLAAADAAVGNPVTAMGPGTRFGRYSTGMTPGDLFYLSGTAGSLDDAATTGGDRPIARALSATDIEVIGWY